MDSEIKQIVFRIIVDNEKVKTISLKLSLDTTVKKLKEMLAAEIEPIAEPEEVGVYDAYRDVLAGHDDDTMIRYIPALTRACYVYYRVCKKVSV